MHVKSTIVGLQLDRFTFHALFQTIHITANDPFTQFSVHEFFKMAVTFYPDGLLKFCFQILKAPDLGF
jgi:hypothetical protein